MPRKFVDFNLVFRTICLFQQFQTWGTRTVPPRVRNKSQWVLQISISLIFTLGFSIKCPILPLHNSLGQCFSTSFKSTKLWNIFEPLARTLDAHSGANLRILTGLSKESAEPRLKNSALGNKGIREFSFSNWGSARRKRLWTTGLYNIDLKILER